jgi:hypothetical protein
MIFALSRMLIAGFTATAILLPFALFLLGFLPVLFTCDPPA